MTTDLEPLSGHALVRRLGASVRGVEISPMGGDGLVAVHRSQCFVGHLPLDPALHDVLGHTAGAPFEYDWGERNTGSQALAVSVLAFMGLDDREARDLRGTFRRKFADPALKRKHWTMSLEDEARAIAVAVHGTAPADSGGRHRSSDLHQAGSRRFAAPLVL